MIKHRNGNPATANREMQQALTLLRRADTETGRADAALGVHSSGPLVALPSHPIYFKG